MTEETDNAKVPWYKNSVVYQIYPWSFKDTNGDGVGDLKGIIEKLDYLNDGTPTSLGVGAIWLSPIYPSPMRDYGYDISDYYGIDPRFGTMEDFELLVSEAHKRNIRIIMDYVSSHTSSDHPWFLEACSSRDNAKRNWYVWKDPKPDGSVPNNWLSIFGGPAWTFNAHTGQYYLHQFLKEQPDLNWRNPEVREEMKRVMDFWLTKGVDGFRVDAISHFIKDSEFRDNPVNERFIEGKDSPYHRLLPKYSADQPELREVVELLVDTLQNHEEKFMVSESSLRGEEFINAYRYSHTKLHAPFNFSLMQIRWSAVSFRKFVDNFESMLGIDEVPTYVLGNHDQPRIASRFDEARAHTLAMLLLTLRGMPFIYYGEELGLKSITIPLDKRRDIFSIEDHARSTGRDPARTPMQWDASKYAGFSSAEPWLPVSRDYKIRNIETQSGDPKSMLNFYRDLIHFRNGSKILLHGSYRSIHTNSKNVYSYLRQYGQKTLLIMLNFSNDIIIEPIHTSTTIEVMCTTYMDKPSGQIIDSEITLRPYEGYVLKI